ncbi:MAG: DUF2971 domain-containing protein [Bacteroidales bacterium]|nr:DUF2971 domain-containing protein [Bacteroidales bacterium]
MQTKKSTFKEMFESVNIPEEMPFDEREKILKPIFEFTQKITPSKLFRYRECEERQFDAFDKNKIFAVNAQMFNDPYDCLPRYNKDLLYDLTKTLTSKDFLKQFRDALNNGMLMPEIFVSLYGEEGSRQIQNKIQNATDDDIDKYSLFIMKPEDILKQVDTILEKAESYLRSRTFIACFSETVKSVTMWSHYAKSHKGFVLEYDLRNIVTKCTNCKEKFNCDDRVFYILYPIVYDKKRYDASAFVEMFFVRELGVDVKVPDVMFFNKGALYKSPQWKYEKEWRLFLNKKYSEYSQYLDIEVKPQAIYYGKDISEINKKILSEMAKKKGIREYQMYIDIQSEDYALKYRRV